jgi:hypothetical protein
MMIMGFQTNLQSIVAFPLMTNLPKFATLPQFRVLTQATPSKKLKIYLYKGAVK